MYYCNVLIILRSKDLLQSLKWIVKLCLNFNTNAYGILLTKLDTINHLSEYLGKFGTEFRNIYVYLLS